MKITQQSWAKGFTIVELLIVIVVIAILAAITIVSYNGITTRAKQAALQADLHSAANQLFIAQTTNGTYPADTSGLTKSDSTIYSYSYTADTFCLVATNASLSGVIYSVNQTGTITSGSCLPKMQTITAANCPSTRSIAVDARDNHTYWVQKINNLCWMETNLAYAGGGTNTYGDTKTLTEGTGGADTFTAPKYYVVLSTTNYTTDPANPSTSTDGTGQYGYLYNWCAAMGGQATAACANSTTPAINVATTVCPAGWRLPTMYNEYINLNTTVNGGSTTTDSGLRTTWLGQRAGYYASGFNDMGTQALYWTSDIYIASESIYFQYVSNAVHLNYGGTKSSPFAVRCVAS